MPSELTQAATLSDTEAKIEAQAEFFGKLAGFAKKAMKSAGPMAAAMAGPAMGAMMGGGNPLQAAMGGAMGQMGMGGPMGGAPPQGCCPPCPQPAPYPPPPPYGHPPSPYGGHHQPPPYGGHRHYAQIGSAPAWAGDEDPQCVCEKTLAEIFAEEEAQQEWEEVF